MATGTVRLNGRFWADENLKINKHRLSQRGRISYPTVRKYLSGSGDVTAFDGRVLYAILVEGMGYSPEDVAQLRVGDVFDFVPNEER